MIFQIRDHMANICDNDETRRRVMGWVLGKPPLSTGKLSDAEMIALKRWIGPRQDNGEWISDPEFAQEFEWCKWAVTDEEVKIIYGPMVTEAANLGGEVREVKAPLPAEDNSSYFD